MRPIKNHDELAEFERERALVGIFLDRAYEPETIDWVMKARKGFDQRAGAAWHILIPLEEGTYGVDESWNVGEYYGVKFAAELIDAFGISYKDLPCIVFRAKGNQIYYLKLGEKSDFYNEIEIIGDLAHNCVRDGPLEPDEFRKYVNKRVASHLLRKGFLSATKKALPALIWLLGTALTLAELV